MPQSQIESKSFEFFRRQANRSFGIEWRHQFISCVGYRVLHRTHYLNWTEISLHKSSSKALVFVIVTILHLLNCFELYSLPKHGSTCILVL